MTSLENLILNKEVVLYAHELTIKEWEKHKPIFKKKKEQKLLGDGKNNSSIINPVAVIKTVTYNDHINSQIEKITELLTKAVLINSPEIIKNEFSERFRNKLAPFHKKINSQNDWEILGSFCHYCQIQGIKELYFLSSNKTDFGDITHSDKKIHQDFTNRFPNVVIHYYTDFVAVFDDIENPASAENPAPPHPEIRP